MFLAENSKPTGGGRRNIQVRSVFAYTDPDAALVDLVEGRTRPDLILLDIQMPKTSGFEFLEALRLIPAFADTQVVFLTTSRLSHGMERVQQMTACAHVIKPNTYHELHRRLDIAARRALKRLYPRGCR
jgi:CheY-like chemotaxis protein